ncbi:hypothetical protein MXL46_14065 [Heyndrickxia sporothermodurans]|uniref:hypothetical protein n=1 Tax=Heyndrickxia sporothermodurans TaxID=46224 RepID=UPI002DB74849|nr:hypothetical protein [Heyndrickxia sporothermodurans]MEB6550217.1 hypothetical protein [Heyndrickxia sporothermodurans]
MKTCKYCGTTLNFIGEYNNNIHFHCPYCDITFEIDQTCENRKRKPAIPESYANYGYYKNTKELLKENTISLFHLLKDCRRDWYSVFTLLSQSMNVKENEFPNEVDLEKYIQPLYEEYVLLTKQKFIIENILLEKAGFIPEKITEEFLSTIISDGKKLSGKPMYIYIKKNKNKVFA